MGITPRFAIGIFHGRQDLEQRGELLRVIQPVLGMNLAEGCPLLGRQDAPVFAANLGLRAQDMVDFDPPGAMRAGDGEPDLASPLWGWDCEEY